MPLLKMPLNKLHFITVEQNTHNYLSHFILLPANYSSHSLWNLQHISDPSSLFLFLSFFFTSVSVECVDVKERTNLAVFSQMSSVLFYETGSLIALGLSMYSRN